MKNYYNLGAISKFIIVAILLVTSSCANKDGSASVAQNKLLVFKKDTTKKSARRIPIGNLKYLNKESEKNFETPSEILNDKPKENNIPLISNTKKNIDQEDKNLSSKTKQNNSKIISNTKKIGKKAKLSKKLDSPLISNTKPKNPTDSQSSDKDGDKYIKLQDVPTTPNKSANPDSIKQETNIEIKSIKTEIQDSKDSIDKTKNSSNNGY